MTQGCKFDTRFFVNVNSFFTARIVSLFTLNQDKGSLRLDETGTGVPDNRETVDPGPSSLCSLSENVSTEYCNLVCTEVGPGTRPHSCLAQCE